MVSSDFRTAMTVTVWPTTAMDEQTASAQAALLPSLVLTDDHVDMDVEVSFEPEESKAEMTVWNVGLPADAFVVFRKNHLIALDLGRNNFGSSTVQVFRSVVGRIDGVTMEVDENSGDVAYKVTLIPLDYRIREVHVRHSFLASEGPHRLKKVLSEMLKVSGFGAFRVDLSEDYLIPNFTADGPLMAEMRRAAAKAGTKLGIFIHGGSVVVSDSFLVGLAINDDFVLDARAVEKPGLQTPLPIDIDLEAGAGTDLAEESLPATDEDQLVLGAPASGNFEIETVLLPEALRGMQIKVTGQRTLERMGILGTKEKVFNIISVKHMASSRADAAMDITRLGVATAVEEVQA